MIRNQQTAAALRDALTNLEKKRINLEGAPDEELIDRANEYQAARESALPAFSAAQTEYDREDEAAPPVERAAERETHEAPATEASPGVPLVQPPGVLVTAPTVDRYGVMAHYRSKEDPTAELVEATPYAFAEGTAVQVVDGDVAIEQPSRVIRAEGQLAVVTNDVFNQTYELAEPKPAAGTPPTDAERDASEAAAEKEASTGDGATTPPAGTQAEAPVDEQPEGGSTPPVS